MAYERSICGVRELFPTARLQIVRELYHGEWHARSKRLGAKLYPMYFPECFPSSSGAPSSSAVAGKACAGSRSSDASATTSAPLVPGAASSAAAGSAAGDDDGGGAHASMGVDDDDADELSAYERQRNKTILENQQKLKDLGLLDMVAQMGGGKKKGKAAVPKPKAMAAAAGHGAAASSTAALPAPSRGSSRIASQPRVSYAPAKAVLPSDDEGEEEDEEDDEEDDEDADMGDDEEDEEEGGLDGDEGGGGVSSSFGKPKKKSVSGKGKAKAKAKAVATDKGGTAKRAKSRGARASVVPGGRGFKCPKDGCETYFDTAEEAWEHGAEACGIVPNGPGGRVFDEAGRSPCLWGALLSSFWQPKSCALLRMFSAQNSLTEGVLVSLLTSQTAAHAAGVTR